MKQASQEKLTGLNASRESLRGCGKIGKRVGKIEGKKRRHDSPHYITPLAAEVQAELCQRYDETGNPETRTRSQMVLLAQRGHTAPQIARLVLRQRG